MTSTYLGSDQTEYILDSGRKIVLSIEEFNELFSEVLVDYEDLENNLENAAEQIDELEEELSTYFNAIETIKKVVDECPV